LARADGAAGEGCGFAAGGAADGLAPGPALAGLADQAAAGLGRCSDDELIGFGARGAAAGVVVGVAGVVGGG